MKKRSFIFAIMLAFALTACTESIGAGVPQSTPDPQ